MQQSRGPRPAAQYPQAAYFPASPRGGDGGDGGDDDGFWEKYKYWLVAAAAVSAAIGIYFYLKSKQDEADDDRKRGRLEDRMKAEQYAEKRAHQLAQVYLKDAMTQRGVRHDLGDPGIQSDLAASHDWEANTDQKASPGGVAVTSEITQIATPAETVIDEEEDYGFDVDDDGSDDDIIY